MDELPDWNGQNLPHTYHLKGYPPIQVLPVLSVFLAYDENTMTDLLDPPEKMGLNDWFANLNVWCWNSYKVLYFTPEFDRYGGLPAWFPTTDRLNRPLSSQGQADRFLYLLGLAYGGFSGDHSQTDPRDVAQALLELHDNWWDYEKEEEHDDFQWELHTPSLDAILPLSGQETRQDFLSRLPLTWKMVALGELFRIAESTSGEISEKLKSRRVFTLDPSRGVVVLAPDLASLGQQREVDAYFFTGWSDLIFGLKPSQGQIAIHDQGGTGWIHPTFQICRKKYSPDEWETVYLNCILRAAAYRQLYLQGETAANQTLASLWSNVLSKVAVPLPTAWEQRKIIKALNQGDITLTQDLEQSQVQFLIGLALDLTHAE